MAQPSVGVVIATRNRAAGLATTLSRLTALPERPRVLVVDNASTDSTRNMIARRFPRVGVLPLPANRGALARNDGVRLLDTPYVAFSDDDSWWEPGALGTAAHHLDTHPRIGLLAARTLVGPEAAPDSLNAELAASPLGRPPGFPGPLVLGFLGCAAVVRRSAFLDAGGYHPLLFFGAEETLLAYDLTARGHLVCHAPDVLAHHHPSDGPRPHRRALVRRNELLTVWLRRPLPVALRRTGRLGREAAGDPAARRALRGALPRIPAALAHRRRLPAGVEAAVRRLERTRPEKPARSGRGG
ncbi:glycosyltransferase [Streptomyces sp. ACA25]|uniref:glycosyltransferase family 2 protein n=1 Tax=Streptomyces sp. ACA25 TaxID=3022596 RepID=UPI0023072E7B|nr:glycosyltransferase [Streptomyces sp. ACA25]MDB1087845.1 glycosyltransferase [Streptomyces sp. ACA25]